MKHQILRPVLGIVAAAGIALGLTACSATGDPSSQSSDSADESVTLYIVRHGKTVFNEKSIVSGWTDSPLTDVGVSQAEAAGAALADVALTKAYSSDLDRAEATASIILDENSSPIELQTLEGLREQNYGGYEGVSDADLWGPLMTKFGFELDPEWSNATAFFEATTDEQRTDAIAEMDETGTAETWAEWESRVQEALDTIIDESLDSGGGNVLVVSHGGTISMLLELIDPDGYNGETIDNGSITTVTYTDGTFTIEAIGQTNLSE